MNKYKPSFISLAAFFILICFGAFGQQQKPAGPPKPKPYVPSEYPKILPDKRVEFKLTAPNAQKVQIEFGQLYDMEKREDGSWFVTSEPRIPGLHYYWYIIDGLRVSNPESKAYYNDRNEFMSGVDIPEDGVDFYKMKDVPHGDIRTERYFSKTTQSWRQLNVYTPPGYDKNTGRKYPVLYLQHGGGENEWGWVIQGTVAPVMDNLIASGKAVPMLIVMANGHVARELNAAGGYSEEGLGLFKDELTGSVIPFIEKKYHVNAERKSRALAGLSMGGGQSFYTGLQNLDIFGSVATFSSGIFGGPAGLPQDFDAEKEIPGILTDAQSFNQKLDVFYISVGENDPRFESTKAIVKIFEENGLDVNFNSFPGAHDFQVWRKSLNTFASLLFKD